MEFQPAAPDGEREAGLVFVRRASLTVQERAVDLLDVDAAILHDLKSVGELHQLARGLFRISEGRSVVSFMLPLPRFVPRAPSSGHISRCAHAFS